MSAHKPESTTNVTYSSGSGVEIQITNMPRYSKEAIDALLKQLGATIGNRIMLNEQLMKSITASRLLEEAKEKNVEAIQQAKEEITKLREEYNLTAIAIRNLCSSILAAAIDESYIPKPVIVECKTVYKIKVD